MIMHIKIVIITIILHDITILMEFMYVGIEEFHGIMGYSYIAFKQYK